MTYEELLDAQPPPALYGNFDLAQDFVTQLTTAIHDKTQHWTPAQKAYLYRLYRKWWRRAQGQDLQWNVTAPRPGRPQKQPARTRRTARRAKDVGDTQDPLVQRIIAKYGNIR
jgi:hypothetical protein